MSIKNRDLKQNKLETIRKKAFGRMNRIVTTLYKIIYLEIFCLFNIVCNKIDVIINGIETIGSASRSCDRHEMLEQFNTISNGVYASLLYNAFTRSRVKKELNEYLSLDFFPRYGGGCGITRMASALKNSGIEIL